MPVEFDAEIAINEVTLQADSDISTPGTGDTSYLSLTEKPQINGVTIVGNKSTEELNIDHVLVADNLSAHDGTTNTTPYSLRTPPSYAGSVAELKKIVGGTIGWNQRRNPPTTQYTFEGCTTWYDDTTHKFYIQNDSRTALYNTGSSRKSIGTGVKTGHYYIMTAYPNEPGIGVSITGANTNINANTIFYADPSLANLHDHFDWRITNQYDWVTAHPIGNVFSFYANIFDLTEMFGNTIASAVYAADQATPGSGYTWFTSLFPEEWYAYSATALQSVNTSARKVLDSNGNTLRTYPLDSDLTLRGIPKLANGLLYFEGDIYPPSGNVDRKYAEGDLGDLNWTFVAAGGNFPYGYFWANVSDKAKGVLNLFVAKYPTESNLANLDKVAQGNASYARIYIVDSAYSDASLFKTAVTGTKFVYELATPTTETADPYTEVQLVDNQGSEQFVCSNNTPVGNETFYPMDLTGVVQDLAPLPTTAGTYKLQVTVSGGVPSYAWVSG